MSNNSEPSPQPDRQSPSHGRPSRSTTPDDLWKLYDGRKVSLKVKILPEKNREGLPSILLEGDETSLEWLADFILASAADEGDCGSFVAPDGPGNIFFDKESEFGIYIHRLPCLEKSQPSCPSCASSDGGDKPGAGET